MRPLGHILLVVIPVGGYVGLRERRRPSLKLLAVAVFASQFPDFIDKPLAHVWFLLPSGRVFMHSLPFAIPVALAVLGGGWTHHRRGSVVFVFGYLIHVLIDGFGVTSITQLGRLRSLSASRNLFWPFVTPVQSPAIPRWAGPGSINTELWTIYSTGMLSLAAALLVAEYLEKERSLQ